jgi:hypothetical protein
MDLVTALAVVIGVMGAIATWVAVTLLSPYFLIWAIFIAWGSFYHCGGKEAGLKNSLVANIWGIICAAVGLSIAAAMGVTPITAAICVGVTVAIMIFGAKVPALSAIPAGVYGYASTAAISIHGGADLSVIGGGAKAIFGAALGVAISMAIGNILGYISEKVAGSLVKS